MKGSSAADAFKSMECLDAFDKMRISSGQLAPAHCLPESYAAVTQLLAGSAISEH